MSALGPGTAALTNLLRESQRMATELLQAIHRLQVKGNCTKWKSFTTALKQVWSQRDIDDFANGLVKIQTQLASRMQMLLLNNLSELHQTISGLEEENRKLNVQRRQELRQMKEDLIESFKKSSELVSHEIGTQESALQTCVRRSQQMLPIDQESVQQLSVMLQSLARENRTLETLARTSATNHQFLRSVHFNQLETRHRKILRAHRLTFEWVFEQFLPSTTPHCAFIDWLRYGNGFYWVQGKAGSGKSTLMKFICQDSRTTENLCQWAGNKNLVTASFFFWNSGSKLQRSQEGLMRSLLFEVLRNCPELIARAAQTRAEYWGCEREHVEWSAEELLEIFKAVLRDNTSTKFCFFIDGLDEYKDENRTCKDLLQTLEILAASPDIKLCVSSRPWMVFADAFGENHNRFLKLEDLTRGDIRRYVTDKFHQDSQFRRLEINDRSFSDLIEEVVLRAQGVFLWVFLVVRDLLEGFTYHDTVETLHRRLLSFPPDLERYFQHMVDSIPKFYRRETAQVFRIALAAPQPLPAVAYSFWDDLSGDPEFALRQPREPMKDDELTARQDRTRRRLDGRCKGLLEMVAENRDINKFYRYRVDFLHRTVRDFINESDPIEVMASRDAGQDCNADLELALCQCLLSTIKRSPKLLPSRQSEKAYLVDLVGTLLRIAHDAEGKACSTRQSIQELVAILEDAENTFIQQVSVRGRCMPKDGPLFIGLACQYDVYGYVQYRLTHQTRPFIPAVAPGRQLLDYALIGDNHSHRPPLRIVQLLLASGTDQIQSCWANFLERISRGEVNSVDPANFEIVRLLLHHGADMTVEISDWSMSKYEETNATVESPSGDSRTARDIIRVAFPDTAMLLEPHNEELKQRGNGNQEVIVVGQLNGQDTGIRTSRQDESREQMLERTKEKCKGHAIRHKFMARLMIKMRRLLRI